MKKIIFVSLLTLLILGCSSPKAIVLTDGSVIKTKDEPDFKRKTNHYEYVDEEGNEGSVNAQSVKIIQPIDAEIPKAKIEEVAEPSTIAPAPTAESEILEPAPATTVEPITEPVVEPVAEVPTTE